ncbi:MAG: cobalt ECF transporter T component CbiQ [wastewater metagenome]|nr:cobalt ECF transporter T component CbiQ [Candidatus Loosdrechtia aerotolerans]
MGFFHHTFSDTYARRDNWLTTIDIRIKLLSVVCFLVVNLLARNIYTSLFFLFASVIFLLSIKIPVTAILRSMVIPISFALFILLIRGLHEGERVLISFSIIGYEVVLREEGLWSGFHMCCKVLGGVLVVILLSFTTTINQLCAGLKWFRMPDTIIELLAFIYRYIFLLFDEVSAMWTAQKSRLGHTTWKKTIRSCGILGGMLIIRAFERAERTYEAMRARCYEGDGIIMNTLPPWGKREYLIVVGIVSVIPLLMYLGTIQVW